MFLTKPQIWPYSKSFTSINLNIFITNTLHKMNVLMDLILQPKLKMLLSSPPPWESLYSSWRGMIIISFRSVLSVRPRAKSLKILICQSQGASISWHLSYSVSHLVGRRYPARKDTQSSVSNVSRQDTIILDHRLLLAHRTKKTRLIGVPVSLFQRVDR